MLKEAEILYCKIIHLWVNLYELNMYKELKALLKHQPIVSSFPKNEIGSNRASYHRKP